MHKALGLEEAGRNSDGFYASAAPLSKETFEYFQSLDMPIQEVFGCTEASGPQTTNLYGFGCTKPGTVGRSHYGVEVQYGFVVRQTFV